MSITIISPHRVNFNPHDLGNLQYWYDAADTDTIVASSGSVSQWKDKSPNQYHLAQGTGANQPVTNSRTINGLNAIDFDGTQQFLFSSSTPPSDARSLFMVFHNDVNIDETTDPPQLQLSSYNDGYSIGTGLGAATGAFLNEVLTVFDEDTPNIFVDRQGVSNANLPDITVDDHFYSIVRGASNWFMGFDGSADLRNLTSGTRRDLGWNTYCSGLCVGAGGRKVGGPVEYWFNGLIAEIIMFSDELTTAERQLVEGYLAWKWGGF